MIPCCCCYRSLSFTGQRHDGKEKEKNNSEKRERDLMLLPRILASIIYPPFLPEPYLMSSLLPDICLLLDHAITAPNIVTLMVPCSFHPAAYQSFYRLAFRWMVNSSSVLDLSNVSYHMRKHRLRGTTLTVLNTVFVQVVGKQKPRTRFRLRFSGTSYGDL